MGQGSARPRVAVVGLGGRGLDYFASTWRRSRKVELVAVADRDPVRLARARKRLGRGLHYAGGHDELLVLDGFTAVAVATDPASHARIAGDLLRAGKDVICEKPLAETARDCARLIRSAQDHGRQLSVGFCLRFGAFFRAMKDLVDGGAIGPVRVAMAYDAVEAGARYYFHNRRRKLRSLTLEKGVHTLDIVNWIIGSVPRRVAAFGGLDYFGGDRAPTLTCDACPDQRTCPEDSFRQRDRWLPEHFDPAFKPYDPAAMPRACVFRRDIRYHDNLTAVIEYANGARATYVECHFTPAYSRRFVFIGDRGELAGDSFTGEIRVHERFTDKLRTQVVQGKGDHGGGDAGQMRAWLRALADGQPLVPEGSAGLYATAIAEAIDRSIAERRMVTIPTFREISTVPSAPRPEDRCAKPCIPRSCG